MKETVSAFLQRAWRAEQREFTFPAAHHVSAQVDAEDGDSSQRERNAGDDEEEEGRDLRDVARQRVRDGLLQVVKDETTCGDHKQIRGNGKDIIFLTGYERKILDGIFVTRYDGFGMLSKTFPELLKSIGVAKSFSCIAISQGRSNSNYNDNNVSIHTGEL